VGLDKLDADADAAAVRDVVRDSFGATAEDLVVKDVFNRSLSRTRDSIIAIKFVQEEHTRPIEA
jgi:hypothetical protein